MEEIYNPNITKERFLELLAEAIEKIEMEFYRERKKLIKKYEEIYTEHQRLTEQ